MRGTDLLFTSARCFKQELGLKISFYYKTKKCTRSTNKQSEPELDFYYFFKIQKLVS